MNEGLDLSQLRDFIVRPALRHIDLWSEAAEQLVLATAAAESGFRYIDQVDIMGRPGPAYGLWQMERRTHDDIWGNYLRYYPALAAKVRERLILPLDNCAQMAGNHYYAAIMCRLHYRRVSKPLPAAGDIEAMARYWKDHYNTALGAGTVEGFKAKSAPVFLNNRKEENHERV